MACATGSPFVLTRRVIVRWIRLGGDGAAIEAPPTQPALVEPAKPAPAKARPNVTTGTVSEPTLGEILDDSVDY
jgi:hypothetical protein